MKPSILVVDDDAAMCDVLAEALGEQGFRVTATTRPDDALRRALQHEFDAVVADLNMPGRDGLSLTRALLAARPDLPVILITAFGSMDAAIGAIRAGAYDFVTKPLDPDALGISLRRATEVSALRREVAVLRREVAASSRFGEMLGESPAMRALFDVLDRVAAQDVTVLVQGETGTGKELVARAMHERSARSGKPFVAVNCAAVPETLVESELFGHARGAFTDARSARKGLVFQAEGGTLFLDEVGELPLSMQPKLLRALQQRSARPVGGDRETSFDVRVIAATNRDLLGEVEAGKFRADLYYRLAVVAVDVPALRARQQDIVYLAQHFLELYAARMSRPMRALSPEVVERLLAWRWPGNVRELQNTLERAVALSRSDTVQVDDLPAALRTAQAGALVGDEALLTLDELERRHILRVIDAVGGSKAQAARVLGVDRATLYRKLERYER